MPVDNPFAFGRELTSCELVDRDDEQAALVRVLQENGRLFLVGPRRYGKTSLLRVAAKQAEREGGGVVVLRHDAEAYPTLHRLTEGLLSDATRRLAGPAEKAEQKLSCFFGALRPEVSFDPVTGGLSASLGASDQAPSPALLVEVLGGIDRLAGESGKRVGVVLDEFQHVVDLNDGFAAERQLRAAVQTHANLAYVFAGSKTSLLSEMTGNADRPFYRLGERLFLGPVPRPDFRAFLHRGFASGGFHSTDEATEAVLDAAEDVPYNVQRLAHACWNDLLYRGAAAARLESSDVARVLGRLVAQDDPFYAQT